MEAAVDTPSPVKRQPFNRSRVGNGRVLLAMTDGRSMTARRFQDLFEDVCGDLGGRDALSESQLQLVRRVATLSAESERLESEWANGREFDLAQYTVLANCLRRLVETLGLKRVARPVNGPLTLAEISARIKAERQSVGSL
jgi:hypothetical protein